MVKNKDCRFSRKGRFDYIKSNEKLLFREGSLYEGQISSGYRKSSRVVLSEVEIPLSNDFVLTDMMRVTWNKLIDDDVDYHDMELTTSPDTRERSNKK